MSENTHKRKTDIVFLNILFCMLVMFIHVASEIVTKMPKDTYFFRTVFSAHRLSSFVVQGFILLSGVKLFLHKRNGINYFKYYFSRFFRIVIPYIIWVIIYYIYFCSKNYFSFSFSDLMYHIVRGDLSAHFYFVIILVQFDILAPLWMALFKRGNAAVHVAFSLILTVIASQYLMPILTTLFPLMPNINLDNCFLRYQIYWTAGCMIGMHYGEFQNYLKSNKIYIIIVFLLCAAANVSLTLVTVGHFPVWLDFIHIMYCMAAILFFYMVSQLFAGVGGKILKPLSLIDKSSYSIYLIHCLILVMADFAMTDYGIMSLTTRFGIRAAAVYGISIVVCLIWQLVKYPFARFIRKS